MIAPRFAVDCRRGRLQAIFSPYSQIGTFCKAILNLAFKVQGRDVERRNAVTVAAQNVHANPTTTRCAISSRYTDTGSGMAPEVLERVFQPFFHDKAVRWHGLWSEHGQGLCLAVRGNGKSRKRSAGNLDYHSPAAGRVFFKLIGHLVVISRGGLKLFSHSGVQNGVG
jgi:C4-dicarboxylate-specific signal transduction histidine kinase